MIHYFKFTKQRKQYYISWNILFLWGLGLWIALCTSNMYHSDILATRETEPMESFTYITTTNCTLDSTVLPLESVLQYVYVPISICVALILLYMREHIKKSLKILNDMVYNIYSIGLYSKTIASDLSNYVIERTITKSSVCILNPKLVIHYEISPEYLQKKFNYTKVEEYILKGQVVQNGIKFKHYTFFLFNRYTIYSSLNNQQLQNTCNLLTKYSEIYKSEYMKQKLLPLNNKSRNNSNLYTKKSSQNGIITSSPEFKKFLANLQSQNSYPCMIEMSASYVIYIKATYK